MRSIRSVVAASLAFLLGIAGGTQIPSLLLPQAAAEDGFTVTMAVPPANPTAARAAQRRASRVGRKKVRGQAAGPACKRREQKVAETIRAYRACRTDDDCKLLVRGCSPYLTCGQPVNEAGLNPVKEAIAGYAKQCPERAPSCLACPERGVRCEAGLCRVYPPIVCTQEVRSCPDGSTVSRNPDYDCQFDPCPAAAAGGGAAEGGGGSGQQ